MNNLPREVNKFTGVVDQSNKIKISNEDLVKLNNLKKELLKDA